MNNAHLDAFRVRMMGAYKVQMAAAGMYLHLGNTEQLNWALEDALYYWMQT